jgi:hypothetical protein
MPNLSLWWEMHERYDEALLKHTQFETDEDFMESSGIINIDNGKKKKTKKAKKQASSSSESAAKQGDASESKQVINSFIVKI